MNSLGNSLKRTIGFGVFGAAILFGASVAANAQSGYYDPYYDQGYYNQNQRYQGSHRREEKRDLKHHQWHERNDYGNSWELRRHQEMERRQLKRHQRYEQNDGYYDDRRRRVYYNNY